MCSIAERIKKAREGDEKELSSLVEENCGLVWSVVKRYLKRGAEAEDLFQIGSIGLIKAIKKFDLSYNVKFSTYAVPMIMGEIKRFLRDDGMIKVSRSIKENAVKINGIAEVLRKRLMREPTIYEIATEAKMETEDVVEAMEAYYVPESLDGATGSGGEDSLSLIDRLSSGEDEETHLIEKILLKDLINSLSARERQIIVLRYFKEKTQTEIASMFGISQVQVSRIEKKLLLKMKEKIAK